MAAFERSVFAQWSFPGVGRLFSRDLKCVVHSSLMCAVFIVCFSFSIAYVLQL